jgi:hypothetical protein
LREYLMANLLCQWVSESFLYTHFVGRDAANDD